MPTVDVRGVLPPGGMKVSQLPPLVVEALVVIPEIEAPLLETVTVCVGGSAPFTVKVSDVELAVNVGGVVTTAGVMVYVLELMFELLVAPARLKVTVPTLVAGGVHVKANELLLLVSSIY